MTRKDKKNARSRMMSSVKSKNTAPELNVRKALFARGIRYRLHNKALPGSPDLVFPKYKAVIFIHGCFWHNHHCKAGKLPRTNRDFWKKKLQGNARRDLRNIAELKSMGWRVRVIWSCTLRDKSVISAQGLNQIIKWLNKDSPIQS